VTLSRRLHYLGPLLLKILALLVCIRATEAAEEPTIEDVVFNASCDGTEQRYVLMLPLAFQPEQKHDVLVALHGHGSDRWQFIRDPRGETRAAREVAAKHGMLFVAPDYRARTSWMGPKAEADLVQIIGELRKKHRVARVFVCGGSMGGSSALTFGALHPELVAGIASMNGTANHLEYTGFQDAIAESFGGRKAVIPDEFKKRSAEYWPERLTMPVAMTTGGQDTSVPPQSCQRLTAILKLLGRDVLLIHREEGGHSTDLDDSKAMLEFMIFKARPASEPDTAK